jgi:hypothetical protein
MVGEVWDVRVSSGGGVVVRVVVGIIILHFLGRGEPELSPSLRPNLPCWVIPQGWHPAMVTRYGSCPSTPRRSCPPLDGRSRLSKWLAGMLSEIGVDRRACITDGDSGFMWMMEPSKLSRGVACCKSPLLAHQLSVFFCTGKI